MVSAACKKLLKEPPSPDKMRTTILDLFQRTDHEAALMGAAYVEWALEALLEAHFRTLNSEDRKRMFDGSANGILGSASNKIRVAYASRLITQETYSDLLLMNDIRNVFAHTLHDDCDFKHPLVADDCMKFRSALNEPETIKRLDGPGKFRYVFTALTIYSHLWGLVPRHMLSRALMDGGEASRPRPSPDKSAPLSRRKDRRASGRKRPRRQRRPSRE